MHEHDLELIAEHAEGLLVGEAGAEAAALVETCPDCRLEFESQRQIRALMRSLPAPVLTDDDRDHLRTGVMAELEPQQVTRPAPVIDLASRRQRRWLAVASVAASVFVFVGLAGVLSQIAGDGDESALDAAAEQPAEEVGAAAETTVPSASAMIVPSSPEFAADAAEQAPAPAAESEGGQRTGLDDGLVVIDLGPVTDDALQSAIDESLARASESDPDPLTPAYFNDRERPVPTCLGEAELPVVAVLEATVDSVLVEVFILVDGGEYRAQTFDTAGCVEYAGS